MTRAAAMVVIAVCALCSAATAAVPSFGARDLAVVVNEANPLSVAIASYYGEKRSIPPGNFVHVRFDATRTTLSADEFSSMRAEIVARTPPHVGIRTQVGAAVPGRMHVDHDGSCRRLQSGVLQRSLYRYALEPVLQLQ